MSDRTKIEWTDTTWNPVTGCGKVSSGCKHCYAEREWPRLAANPKTRYFGRRFTQVGCHPEVLSAPLRWKRPRRIFVNSMSDLFHEDIPDAFLDEMFAVMLLARQHQFQVLTKRPERMAEYFAGEDLYEAIVDAANRWRARFPRLPLVGISDPRKRLPRWIWLGVSVENQATAEERIPLLLQTPATVRWISAEPLLGPLRLDLPHPRPSRHDPHGRGIEWVEEATWLWKPGGLDWVVVGGESGPGARAMHPDWVRAIRDQCFQTGTPFLFKQWGEWAPICVLDEAAQDNLYLRNREAREGEDQAIIDEIYGHTCTVRQGVLGVDGVLREMDDPWAFQADKRPSHTFLAGRKRAGRLLDGREWDEYPPAETADDPEE